MIRVLLADDSATVREYLAYLPGEDPTLEVVGTARDGLEAVAEAERLKPDIIVMDVHMPRMNGFEATRQMAILVVDDSITTRTMEKNLLEAAGYRVRVAADGLEGWTALKEEDFDLVVSDVDMPRMDGFELTARIRADRKLADLPVVLVTALESREDKERGIEVGANAYVIKSSFDQSNLLEIIRRLI